MMSLITHTLLAWATSTDSVQDLVQTCLLSCFTWETPALEVHLPISPNLLFWEKVSWCAKDAGLGRWGDCRNVILGIFCYKFSYLANKLCGTM